MTSKIIYGGNLRTTATHVKSGTQIETDAPTDNNGKAERFSPTDLVATALGSCMMTYMGITAKTHDIRFDAAECEIEKIMESNPRRIGEIKVRFTVRNSSSLSDKEKSILENSARSCAVLKSLSEQTRKTIDFIWD